MDYTMLKQMARRSRLLAFLHDNESEDLKLQSFTSILEPEDNTKPPISMEVSSFDMGIFLAQNPKLNGNEYSLIQQYLHTTGRPYRNYLHLPHPENALILPPNAKRPRQFHDNGRTYSCYSSHQGNSAIQFHDRQSQQCQNGVIESILELPLQGFLSRFILVRTFRPLNAFEHAGIPYSHFPNFMAEVVDPELSENIIVIETKDIITHLTTYKRPVGAFNCTKEILVICWALNRGRK